MYSDVTSTAPRNMTKAERKKLLNDKWPAPSSKEKKAMMAAIKKASKAKVFEYENSEDKHPVCQ